MIKTSLLAVVVIASLGARADAGGSPGSMGVGADYQLSGLGGLSMNYDAGQFHVGPFLSYFDPAGANNTVFEIGGRFFYHIHSTAMADFGIGGNLGIESIPVVNNAGNSSRNDYVFLEPAFQIRLFVASNVALSFTGGLSIGVVDASGVALTGQGIGGGSFSFDPGTGVGFLGGAGVHYYFF
jgi:hypothetical protein